MFIKKIISFPFSIWSVKLSFKLNACAYIYGYINTKIKNINMTI